MVGQNNGVDPGLGGGWGYGAMGFRPLLRGLVMADGWAMAASRSAPSAPEIPWPEAWLRVAEACATGQVVSPAVWHRAMAAVQALTPEEQALIDVVVATPWLLIQANLHGHHRGEIQAWGYALGLISATGMALVDYAQRLGQPGWVSPLGGIPPSRNRWDLAEVAACPNWDDIGALVASLPGQWHPALALAQRWGWPSAALALVGILSWSGSGLGSLPWLSPTDISLGPRWRGYTLAHIDALADALHRRWAGVHLCPSGEAPIMANDLRVV